MTSSLQHNTQPPPKTRKNGSASQGRRASTKPKPNFICSICNVTFKRSEHLIRHKRSHTLERPFGCPQCGTCFTRKDLLVRHQRTCKGVPSRRRRKSVVPIIHSVETTNGVLHPAITPSRPSLPESPESQTGGRDSSMPLLSPPILPSTPTTTNPQKPHLHQNNLPLLTPPTPPPALLSQQSFFSDCPVPDDHDDDDNHLLNAAIDPFLAGYLDDPTALSNMDLTLDLDSAHHFFTESSTSTSHMDYHPPTIEMPLNSPSPSLSAWSGDDTAAGAAVVDVSLSAVQKSADHLPNSIYSFSDLSQQSPSSSSAYMDINNSAIDPELPMFSLFSQEQASDIPGADKTKHQTSNPVLVFPLSDSLKTYHNRADFARSKTFKTISSNVSILDCAIINDKQQQQPELKSNDQEDELKNQSNANNMASIHNALFGQNYFNMYNIPGADVINRSTSGISKMHRNKSHSVVKPPLKEGPVFSMLSASSLLTHNHAFINNLNIIHQKECLGKSGL